MASSQFFSGETFLDSEDLMSWLLLNPEVDLDNLTTVLSHTAEQFQGNNSNNNTYSQQPSMSNFLTAPLDDFCLSDFADDTNQSNNHNPTAMTSQQTSSSSQAPVEYVKSYTMQSDSSLPMLYSYVPVLNSNSFSEQQQLDSSSTSYSLQNPNNTNNNTSSVIPSFGLSSIKSHSTVDICTGPINKRSRSSANNNNSINNNNNNSSNNLMNLSSPTSPHTLTTSNSYSTLSTALNTTTNITNNSTNNSNNNNNKKRQRESVEDLEARVNELKAENADLHAHLLNVTQRTTEVQKQRVSMERLMATKLAEIEARGGSDQGELAMIVKQYTDIYADYGRCRQREIAYHLQQVEKLIVPTLTTKMCLWTLQQDKSFYQRNKSPMFDLLCKELEITPEQTEKIVERRERIKMLLDQLRESIGLLQSLKEATEKKHASYDFVCGRVQNAAQPNQTVRFLIWIVKHADVIAKYVPGFTVRSASHVPQAEFVDEMHQHQHQQQQ